VDSGVYAGYTVSPFYDSMISKLIAWGKDRDEAISRMRRALYEYVIVGTQSNILFHKAVMDNPRFIQGELGTHFIEQETGLMEDMKTILSQEQTLADKLPSKSVQKARVAAVAATAVYTQMLHQQQTKP